MTTISSDYLIIGAGIIGLSIAKTLQERFPTKTITIIEKESAVGLHASGRNSGVLHAGFYYTSDSLKARFTRDGNSRLRAFCHEHELGINECGKVVIAQNEEEVSVIYELEKRGVANGVDVSIVDKRALAEIDPNAETCEIALYSPTTATVDPKAVVEKLKEIVVDGGATLCLDTKFMKRVNGNLIETNRGNFVAKTIINASGLYADRIAGTFGFGTDYTIIPFKGIYLKYSGEEKPIRTNIYPVPNLKNPFLGVHYTITVDGTIKIGPTAIPAFWRENYAGFENIRFEELGEILWYEAKLFAFDSFHFRSLALEEMKKYSRPHLRSLARGMVKEIDGKKFDTWSTPGIRAQLLNKHSLELVQDFVVEGDEHSIHILNAVSPAFTCSFAFAEWVVKEKLGV